ncbi:MAG: branched-chain amino acid ABC transporter permease [Ideonella sp.]|nr:MAG: branched-chain amino acid ABC transporter permease [Burkholderiaceae bacterium]MBE7418057.1 branched-chain amino acid ABC transporter permease [Ideonella sp.]MBE7425097.1 branched-chain amino acid ABC transporter permease [Ideonella sp.]
MDTSVALQQLVNGLSIGLVYALVAIGLTLIFGVLNVVNFAHGEVYALGAFTGLILLTALAPPLWLVLLLTLLSGGISGWLLERIAFKPFRRFQDEATLRSKAMREATLLSSLAVSTVVREALELKFSGEMQTIAQGYLLQQPIQLGGLVMTDGNLIIFGLSLAMLLVLQFVLYRTHIGLSIRAVSNNVLGASFVGIDTDRTVIATFVVGSMLGAVAGIMVGLYQGAIFPQMGFEPGVKAFVAMVMGGLSSIPGAVVCSLILGVSESVATQYFADGWKALVSYGFLLLTLWLFPSGLFGFKREKM